MASKKLLIASTSMAILLISFGIFYRLIVPSKSLVDENLKCDQLYETRKAQGNIASHEQGPSNNPNIFYVIYNPKLDTCLGLFVYGPDASGSDYNIVDLNTSEALLDYSSYPKGFLLADPKCQVVSQSLMYVVSGKKVIKHMCEGNDLLNQALSRITDFGFKVPLVGG